MQQIVIYTRPWTSLYMDGTAICFYVMYEQSLLIDPADILSHWDPKFDLEDSIEEYNLAEAAHAHGKNCCCSFIFLPLEAYCSLALDVAM